MSTNLKREKKEKKVSWKSTNLKKEKEKITQYSKKSENQKPKRTQLKEISPISF